MKRTSARQTLYCDKALQMLYESYNAILTFANIHQLGKIVLQSAVHIGHVGGWWNSIEALKDVNRTVTNLPLLVQRNVPLDIKVNLLLPNNFDCIEWSDRPNEKGNEFKDIGGSINLNSLKNPLTKRELQTLILLTFQKFSFVDFVLNDVRQIHQLKRAISEELHDTVLPFCGNQNYCYLFEIPFKSIFTENHSTLRREPWKNSIGIHISSWENHVLNDYLGFQKIIQQQFYNSSTNFTIIKFGVTIRNCIDEMNSQFINLRTLPFINDLTYVVCNVSPIKPENFNQNAMQTFLDTQFYTKTYIQSFKVLQNIHVYFRLTFLNNKCTGRKTETESYLRLLNDLNEHSKTYGITYIVNAFQQQTKSGCCSAWWRIDNTSDLTKSSAYFERESEYFGRPTQFKLILNSTRDTEVIMDKTQTLLVLIISAIILILSVCIIIAFWYRLKTLRKRYLTDEDENIFRNGHALGNDPQITNLLERLKFDSKFEIERDSIQLRKFVGKGRFGIVYKSILNDEIEIAVKLPNGECLKEAFISMLAEVKILCYLGYHPFVVGFIGAYTQEIRRGKLYIVTEYCDHGCLQSYLHAKKLKTKVDLNDEAVDMYQFCSFAYQIAKGMYYIAEKKVIHGDLSTRNILLTGELICKIGDFGLSRRLYENVEYVKKTKEPIPWRWLAIESLKSRTFTTKSDVWSFGIAVWEIFTYGDLPHPSKEFTDEFIQEVENGLRLSKARYSNDSIHQKLLECWNTDPLGRPDFDELATFFSALRRAEYDI